MAHGKGSERNAIRRQQALLAIIDECYRQGIPISNHTLMAELTTMGFTISPRQLFRDRTIINQESTFLGDLGESNYSAFLEEVKNNLELAQKEAWTQYQKTWVTKKVIRRQVPDNNGGMKEITEQQVIENQAGPKAKFLEIFVLCQKTMLEMFKGDNIILSVDMLSKKLHQVKEERDGLRNQLARYETKKSQGCA